MAKEDQGYVNADGLSRNKFKKSISTNRKIQGWKAKWVGYFEFLINAP